MYETSLETLTLSIAEDVEARDLLPKFIKPLPLMKVIGLILSAYNTSPKATLQGAYGVGYQTSGGRRRRRR